MSTKSNKNSATGVRYSDEQKKEVVDFVSEYNSSNGRGGQSAAAKKYKVTPLTVSAWIKAMSKDSSTAAKAPKAPKAPKAVKEPKAPKASSGSSRGKRYTPEQKQEVVEFVKEYNSANGRGGQSQAAKKFHLSVLTVSTWLRTLGGKVAKSGKTAKVAKEGKAVAVAVAASASKPAASSSALNSKFASLIEVSDQLRKAESETAKLRAKYDALRASIQALI